MTGRRRLVGLAGLCAGLAGCGFSPLYGAKGGRGFVAQKELGAVSVGIIPDRPGQLLRQALQQRMDGTEGGQRKLYELVVGYAIAADSLGIQQDSTFTRLRQTATATWTLRALGTPPTILATGISRALDGANVIDQQYFAADIEAETAQARIAENIADQIATQVAAYFVRKDAAA